jgi:hypothetical protein
MDHDLGGTPTDIAKFQRDDLSRTQPEAGEEKQNRIISAPVRYRSIRRR